MSDRPTKYRGITKTDAFKKLPSSRIEGTKPRVAYWKLKKFEQSKVRQPHDTSHEITDKTTNIEGDT